MSYREQLQAMNTARRKAIDGPRKFRSYYQNLRYAQLFARFNVKFMRRAA